MKLREITRSSKTIKEFIYFIKIFFDLFIETLSYLYQKVFFQELSILEINHLVSRIESMEQQKVDVVFTWANEYDNDWNSSLKKHLKQNESKNESRAQMEDKCEARYRSCDTLESAINSVLTHFKDLRNIYVVSTGNPPSFISENKSIKWIRHEDIFPSKEDYLPTFNALSIEAFLHKIPGLSDYFIFINDDVIISKPCSFKDFFCDNKPIYRLSERFIPYTLMSFRILRGRDLDGSLFAVLRANRKLHKRYKSSGNWLLSHAPQPFYLPSFIRIRKLYEFIYDRGAKEKFRSKKHLSITNHLVPWALYLENQAIMKPKPLFSADALLTSSKIMNFYTTIKTYFSSEIYFSVQDSSGVTTEEYKKIFNLLQKKYKESLK